MTTHPTTTASRPIATLTGFKPTGELHLGNYAGAILPLARLAADEQRDVYLFVADLHALNGHPDPAVLADRTQRLAAALLACGLDRPNVHLYRQSRVPAIARLAALLSNVTSKGVLNRAHAYKAAVAANAEAGRDPDHGVNMGLYGYPILMAADILALDADEVPVGADQAQHLEIAVDLAQQFARTHRGDVLREPRALITESVATLPGLDGRKMSKSYGNTIALMAEPGRRQGRDPADRHRLHAARPAQGPRRLHAGRAPPRVRLRRHRPGGRDALPRRHHRLRRDQGAARGRHRAAPRPAARPLRAVAHRAGRAPRTTRRGRTARRPARRPGARPRDDGHGALAAGP